MSQPVACRATLKPGRFGCSASPGLCGASHSTALTQQGSWALVEMQNYWVSLAFACTQNCKPSARFSFTQPLQQLFACVNSRAATLSLCSISPRSHCSECYSPTAKLSDISYHFWGRVSASVAVKESGRATVPSTT